MNNDKAPLKSGFTAIGVLLGIPSVLLFTASLGFLAVVVFTRGVFRFPYAAVAALGALLGALGVMRAIGKWGQWLFLLPFVVAPFLFFAMLALSALVGVREPELVGAALTIVILVGASRGIGRFYANRGGVSG